MNLLIWLGAAAVIGGLIGGLIGPFALRLRGSYLAIVSLGLVFLGLHVFRNWTQLTGGPGGTSVAPPLKLGPLDFTKLQIGNQVYSRNQSFFLLIWAIVGLTALVSKNIVRSRPGRAMQAIRDRDVAAEVVGARSVGGGEAVNRPAALLQVPHVNIDGAHLSLKVHASSLLLL